MKCVQKLLKLSPVAWNQLCSAAWTNTTHTLSSKSSTCFCWAQLHVSLWFYFILFDFTRACKTHFDTPELLKRKEPGQSGPVTGLPIKNENPFKPMEVQRCVCGQSINQTTGRAGRIRLSERPAETTRSQKNPNQSFNRHKEQSNLNIDGLSSRSLLSVKVTIMTSVWLAANCASTHNNSTLQTLCIKAALHTNYTGNKHFLRVQTTW